MKKFKVKSLQLKRLELDIQNSINQFNLNKEDNKLVRLFFKKENSINEEGIMFSTCDTSEKKTSNQEIEIISPRYFSKEQNISLYNKSKRKNNIEQKLALKKQEEIKDITNTIQDYFEDEIKALINKKMRSLKGDLKPIEKPREEDGSLFTLIVSCGSRRKEEKFEEKAEKTDKKENNEDNSSCLIF